MSVFSDLLYAIANKRSVLLITKQGRRTVDPDRIHRQPDGTFLVEAFQTSGASDWGMHSGWKNLELEGILGVHKMGRRFKQQPDFNPRPKRQMGRVIAQIGVPPRGRVQDFNNQDFFPFTGYVPEYGGYDIYGQGQFNFPVP